MCHIPEPDAGQTETGQVTTRPAVDQISIAQPHRRGITGLPAQGYLRLLTLRLSQVWADAAPFQLVPPFGIPLHDLPPPRVRRHFALLGHFRASPHEPAVPAPPHQYLVGRLSLFRGHLRSDGRVGPAKEPSTAGTGCSGRNDGGYVDGSARRSARNRGAIRSPCSVLTCPPAYARMRAVLNSS